MSFLQKGVFILNNLFSSKYEDNKKNRFLVIIPFEQILKAISDLELNSVELNDIKYAIINNLKFYDLENLINNIKDESKKSIIFEMLKNESYRWYNEIESEIVKNIEDARLSLNTSDFIAFIIGKKVYLQKIKNSSFFNSIYLKIDHYLNMEIIAPFTLNYFEVEQKSNVPIRQALSLFFKYEKTDAIIKFKRLLNNDIENRLDSSFQAEYFHTARIFFDRLNLDFIPLIDINNHNNPVSLTNCNKDFITSVEIQSIIDKEDYFNISGFKVDIKKLIRKDKITNKEIFIGSYLLFFEIYSKNVTKKQIEVLFSCFTESNPIYDEFEIFDTREILKKALNKENNVHEFLRLNNELLDKGIIDVSRTKLIRLLSMYFNSVKGMGFDNIKLMMTGKKRLES